MDSVRIAAADRERRPRLPAERRSIVAEGRPRRRRGRRIESPTSKTLTLIVRGIPRLPRGVHVGIGEAPDIQPAVFSVVDVARVPLLPPDGAYLERLTAVIDDLVDDLASAGHL